MLQSKRFLTKVIIRDMNFVKRFKGVTGVGSTARGVPKKCSTFLMTS